MQIIAFDSAGCPAPSTRTDLARWIKAATPEPDDEGIMDSEHIWRARADSREFGLRYSVRLPKGGDLAPQPFGPRANRLGLLSLSA